MALSNRLIAAGLTIVLGFPAAAQQPARAQPAFKGVWEPASFTENIDFREVFFVTVDKGWVAGDKGTIIHTKDGGATWTVVMGGDPQATEATVKFLRFVDESHGWAVKDGRILRTEDGESWEDLGAAPGYIQELAMSSPLEGVAAGHEAIGSTLFKTGDGGKTWRPVGLCAIKTVVAGLSKEIGCDVLRIQFVSTSVAWLVASGHCGMGCFGPPILGKTEDGGESWRFFVGPGNPDVVGATDLYFTGENTGVVRTTDGKLAKTTDGGATWKGLLASVGGTGSLIFADPEVGWSMEDYKMSYTMDGGARWNSRAYVFPVQPRAFSLPRRDRAYVVGYNGMVFRYSVLPAAAPVPAASLPAPVMPAFASPLEAQVPELDSFVQELTTVVAQLPDSGSPPPPGAPAPGDPPSGAPASGAPPGENPAGGGFTQDAAPPSPFVTSCCGKPVNRLSAILGAVLQSLPQFVAKFKNTNLLVAGLRMLSTMPSQLGDLRGALRDFKSATDKPGAQAALLRLGSAASALRQSTRTAFQKEGTP